MLIDLQDPESYSMSRHDECFYCEHKLGPKFIEWNGQGKDRSRFLTIALHPECVIELTLRLMRDVHEFECTSHVHLDWTEGDDKPNPVRRPYERQKNQEVTR
jgi:hypothetical protein